MIEAQDKPFKVLFVDDEPDLEPLIRMRLRAQVKSGLIELTFAENGKDALEKLHLYPDIQIVFTDLNMPKMDGHMLLANMDELQRVVKSVVVSAYGDMSSIRSAMNEGAFDFLTKPINFQDLNATLEKAIKEVKLLQEAAQAKEDKLKALQVAQIKQDFLANMSHEIRTPMNAIMGMSELLVKTELSGVQKKYIDAIRQSSKNLLVIINDILDFSKIEAGKMTIENMPFDFHQQLQLMKDTFGAKAEEKHLNFIVDIDQHVPQFVIGDPTRLSQILINLTGNALKFTEKGNVTILAALVKQEGDEARIRIEVKDSGIGIPADKIDSIFESFSQAEGSTTRKFGGTGLGLTITRKLLEIQHGDIYVTSDYGKGSVFAFEIPYQITNASAIESAEQVLDVSVLKGIKILLAEDNAFNQMVAEDTIKELIEGVELTIADNGKIAVDLLQKQHFDVILMDVHMPEMDGLEATRYIRSELSAPLRNIPIIAMTASVIQEDVERFRGAGMDSFIPKPFTHNDLIEGLIKGMKKKG